MKYFIIFTLFLYKIKNLISILENFFFYSYAKQIDCLPIIFMYYTKTLCSYSSSNYEIYLILLIRI